MLEGYFEDFLTDYTIVEVDVKLIKFCLFLLKNKKKIVAVFPEFVYLFLNVSNAWINKFIIEQIND